MKEGHVFKVKRNATRKRNNNSESYLGTVRSGAFPNGLAFFVG